MAGGSELAELEHELADDQGRGRPAREREPAEPA